MRKAGKSRRLIYEMCVFSMLGALMFVTKFAMQLLPNIHLVGMLIIAYTAVFRWRALIPIYIFVLLDGIFGGFANIIWWIPYLYIWTLLWGMVMLLPKKMPDGAGIVVYTVICMLHGLFFGALYAPVWAILNGLSFKGMISWIIAGIPFDILHLVGNFASGLLAVPVKNALLKLIKNIH